MNTSRIRRRRAVCDSVDIDCRREARYVSSVARYCLPPLSLSTVLYIVCLSIYTSRIRRRHAVCDSVGIDCRREARYVSSVAFALSVLLSPLSRPFSTNAQIYSVNPGWRSSGHQRDTRPPSCGFVAAVDQIGVVFVSLSAAITPPSCGLGCGQVVTALICGGGYCRSGHDDQNRIRAM